ncbi:hypothetical protein FKW77_001341 [Venturia effusa]|uniref:Uncharacterized protein n=1 Tax=Venturia effusa TaxID=50376 RepID=A0A517LET4_9PEZI|nr:hypothetical protein FKW77_001341 [Venturia effusa]
MAGFGSLSNSMGADFARYMAMDEAGQANALADKYAQLEARLGRKFASQLRDSLPPLDDRFTEIADSDEDVSGVLKVEGMDFVKARKELEQARRESANEPLGSPIQAMKLHIAAILSDTLPLVLYLATAMTKAIEDGTFVIQLQGEGFAADASLWELTKMKPENIWKTCKFVGNFILNVASSKANAYKTCNFARDSKSGDILGLARNQPTASFRSGFTTAKAAARNQKKTTIIGVQLLDVHFLQLSSRDAVAGHCSFAHTFAVAIGPEGFVIWQGWGEHGYRLDEWIDCGGDRVRTWDEAEQFVNDFEKLTKGKGLWNAKRNELYKKLFEVDLNQMCGSQGPEPRCLVPKFEPWVQLEVLADVKVKDILKFKLSDV